MRLCTILWSIISSFWILIVVEYAFWGLVVSLMIVLKIYRWMCQWKNFENWSIFDKVWDMKGIDYGLLTFWTTRLTNAVCQAIYDDGHLRSMQLVTGLLRKTWWVCVKGWLAICLLCHLPSFLQARIRPPCQSPSPSQAYWQWHNQGGHGLWKVRDLWRSMALFSRIFIMCLQLMEASPPVPTGALPLDSPGDVRPPDLLFCPPVANSWPRPWQQ